jgi:LAO/AO transport system kinase
MDTSWKNIDYLLDGIKDANRVILARAITLVESLSKDDQILANELLNALPRPTSISRRIAVSGSPGVGKSTFIESLGMQLANNGEKVAVLAIDPSSSQSKGSILGDKTRMEQLSRHPNAYIRPSPAGETLGGVARSTYASILICEAAGFNHLLIETVGVGQSEITARQLCDFFILLLLPGAGDDLQGIKKGIMESADLLFINKADGPQSERALDTLASYKQALHLYAARLDDWMVPVLTGSAFENKGISEVLQNINKYFNGHESFLLQRRSAQLQYWFRNFLEERIKNFLMGNEEAENVLIATTRKLESGAITPFEASEQAFRSLVELAQKNA